MDVRRTLLFILCNVAGGDAEGTFVFFNAAPFSFDVKWLQKGLADPGEGVSTGSVSAGVGARRGYGSVSTHRGHAFRLSSSRSKSKAFKYEGGLQNLVAIRQSRSDIELDIMGPTELRLMVIRILKDCQPPGSLASPEGLAAGACAKERAKFPSFGTPLDSSSVASFLREYSPANNAPKKVGMQDGLRQPMPPDNLVLMNTLSYPLTLYWAWQKEESQAGVALSAAESKEVGVIPAATPDQPSSLWLAGGTGQMLFVSASNNIGPAQSVSFVYPGELALAAISDNASKPGELQVEFIEEDNLKVLLSGVATECGGTSNHYPTWETCFISRAVLPLSKTQLPGKFATTWFSQLWGNLSHWRLCNYQEDTAPVEHMTIDLQEGRHVKADVLRKEPLVLAVHNLVSKDECQDLIRQVGTDLGMAHVSGGGHSRKRRTLSKNLYVNASDPSSTLTRVTTRFFHVAREVTGFDLQLDGQEPVNWLYYKPGYEYRPHCDGACGSPQIRLGERVMSSLAYCSVAAKGGATVFPPDGIKLTPTEGMLLLFAYNPDPQRLTEHSACPVIDGEKMTATQWYREGVTAEKDWEHWRRVHSGEL